jgi:hypothetical protein
VAYDKPIGPKLNAYRAVSSVPTAVVVNDRAPGVALAVAPNPAAGLADLRFALPTAGPAGVALYDVAGRRVRTLAEGTMTAGPHAVRWDGRDDRGVPLAAGVYFARLTSGKTILTSKVALIER